MASPTLPVLDTLAQVYGPSGPWDIKSTASTTNHLALGAEAKVLAQTQRFTALLSEFRTLFGVAPLLYVRAPGRVNLIGEHIDYSGFSVCPMAIDRDVIIALAPVSSSASSISASSEGFARITIANMNRTAFPTISFTHDPVVGVNIDSTKHEWANYFKCGYKGVFDACQSFFKSMPLHQASFNVLIDGNVPTGAGLSSSAALVCSSALATLAIHNLTMTPLGLTETAIIAERHCGVQSGGMDQSISIMAARHNALLIHFYPRLAVQTVRLPAMADTPVFMIANTLVVSDKAVTAPRNYNLRVVEAKLATHVLAKALAVPKLPAHLRELIDAYLKHSDSQSGDATVQFEGNEITILLKMEQLVEKHLKRDCPFTISDLLAELGISRSEFEQNYLSIAPIEADSFKLYERAKHIFSEARRVFDFSSACENVERMDPEDVLTRMGAVMNASQNSCASLFECSCPELDELTTLCRNFGAYGSRLTGAGWGGCTVSLIRMSQTSEFIDYLKTNYYSIKFPNWGPSEWSRFQDVVFPSRPSMGACIFRELNISLI